MCVHCSQGSFRLKSIHRWVCAECGRTDPQSNKQTHSAGAEKKTPTLITIYAHTLGRTCRNTSIRYARRVQYQQRTKKRRLAPHRTFMFRNEPGHSISYKIACAHSEDSDQPVHPRSLIRVFAGYSKERHGSKASSGRQRWLRSACASAQTDLSLPSLHMQCCRILLCPRSNDNYSNWQTYINKKITTFEKLIMIIDFDNLCHRG